MASSYNVKFLHPQFVTSRQPHNVYGNLYPCLPCVLWDFISKHELQFSNSSSTQKLLVLPWSQGAWPQEHKFTHPPLNRKKWHCMNIENLLWPPGGSAEASANERDQDRDWDRGEGREGREGRVRGGREKERGCPSGSAWGCEGHGKALGPFGFCSCWGLLETAGAESGLAVTPGSLSVPTACSWVWG